MNDVNNDDLNGLRERVNNLEQDNENIKKVVIELNTKVTALTDQSKNLKKKKKIIAIVSLVVVVALIIFYYVIISNLMNELGL